MILENSVLTELHWFNIPDTPSKSSSLENPFLLELKRLTELPEGTPLYIYMWNNFITDLTIISHDSKTIEFLNHKGVHIFLFEPMCAHYINEKHNQQFYSEFPYKENEFYSVDELDSIKEYVIKNNLTNVTVHTCDYNVKKYYSNYSSWMNLICDDLFIKSFTIFNNVDDTFRPNFTKKFICLNWRYTKHRHLISAHLLNKSCYLSWYFTVTNDELKKNLWFDFDSWADIEIIDNLKKLNDASPLCLDIHHDYATQITNGAETDWPQHDYNTPAARNPRVNSLEKFYKDSFCEIVNETRFAQPTGNYSEKVYQAIRYKKPFIIVAPPFTLEYIRSQGFKTFNDFWDESYDTCVNHEQRLLKIFNLIDQINNKSLLELITMYNDMKEIIEHNFKIVISKTPFKSIQQI